MGKEYNYVCVGCGKDLYVTGEKWHYTHFDKTEIIFCDGCWKHMIKYVEGLRKE